MLNYIWAGLIVVSFAFALVNDLRDLSNRTYRNGVPLPVVIEPASQAGGTKVSVRIEPAAYKAHYGVDEPLAASYSATLLRTDRGRELRFAADAPLPPRLAKVRDVTNGAGGRDLFKDEPAPKPLLAAVTRYDEASAGAGGPAEILFQDVRWVKMQAIGNAAMNFARTAIELCLGLIGTLALFLGVMQIAEKAGIIHAVVRVTGPILRPLFPGIPKGHPAMGMVTLNLTANMLGLGNAATPFGIKAMEELQKLNRTTDTATNSMVMLLAMNTAGVQLLPPVFLYAVMGLRASELYIPILIVTGLSLVVAIVSVKLLGMLPGYRASDPDRLPPGTLDVKEVAR
jgi:spore maturation protein A